MALGQRLTASLGLLVLGGCIADITGAPCVVGGDTCPSGQYCGVDSRCVLGTGPGGGSGGGGSSGTDAGTSIEILQTVTRHTESGATPTPTVFAADGMALFVRNGSAFTQVTSGNPGAAGHFTFTGIPPGQRYLRRGKEWLVDPPATVDLSFRIYGRATVKDADAGVVLSVTAPGLDAWTAASELQVVSPNAGLVGLHFEKGVTSTLTAGVAPTSVVFDYVTAFSWSASPPAPLLDTTKGDVVYMTQLDGSSMTTSGGPVPVRALAKSALLEPLILGTATTPKATVFIAPPPVTATVTWRRNDYWQLGSAVTPNYRTDEAYDFLNICAVPYFGSEGIYDLAPDLFFAGDEVTKGGSPNLNLTASFHNPYPPSWTPVVSVLFCHYGPAQTAGGTASIQPYGCAGRNESLANAIGQQMTIGVTPPTNLRIDGASAYGGMTLTTLSPTVSWAAPAVGTPSYYQLEIDHIIPSGTDLTTELTAALVTHGTSVMIPPAVLKSGQYYYLRVAAGLGLDLLATPFKTALSWQYAEGVSGVLKVQ